MKIKYIFSMVAGLIVLATTSCDKQITTEVEADQETPKKAAEVTDPATPATPTTPATPAEQAVVAAPSAYYVMFSGKG
jgi:hypothetical protein